MSDLSFTPSTFIQSPGDIPLYAYDSVANSLLRSVVDALRAKYGYSEEDAIEVLQSKWLRHSTGRWLDANLFKDFGSLMVNTANNPDDYIEETKITPESPR